MNKKTPKQWKDELWKLVKEYNRKEFGDKCFTCDRTGLSGSNQQTGHMIPSGACGALLRYHPNNLRIQCYNCNMNLGGNGAEYLRRMTDDIGEYAIDELFAMKQKTIKADSIFYSILIDLYKEGDKDAIIRFLDKQ